MKQIKAKMLACLLTVSGLCAVAGVGAAAAEPIKSQTTMTAKADDAATLEQQFTGGKFTVSKCGKSTFSFVDAETEGLTGAEGSVLKVQVAGGTAYVNVDFSASKILAVNVKSIKVRIYSPVYTFGTDEFRTNIDDPATSSVEGGSQKQYGKNKYDMSAWIDVPLTEASIADMTDADGYLSMIALGAREYDGDGTFYYISGITIETIEYNTVSLGGVQLNSTSIVTPASNRLYLKPSKTADLVQIDNISFTYESGVGFQVNGVKDDSTAVSIASYKSYFRYKITDSLLKAGDKVTIGGTYYNKDNATKYVIEETTFWWDGAAWSIVDTATEYTTNNLGKLAVHSTAGSATQIYLITENPQTTYNYLKSWDYVFKPREGAVTTITSGGVTTDASSFSMKNPNGSIYVSFGKVQVGDIFTIAGTFYCPVARIEFNITETQFMWNGTVWEKIGSSYTTTKVAANKDSSAKAVYLYSTEGDTFPSGDWGNVYSLVEGSGDGLKLNGTALSTTDIKQPGALYIGLGKTAVAGDVLSIDGTYYNKRAAKSFTFEDCKLQFNGEKWVEYVPVTYTTYTATKLGAWMNGAKTQLFIYPTGEGEGFPKDKEDWTNVYTFEAGSGTGITYNGETSSITDIKQPGDFFINLGKAAEKGDVFNIDGTYYNATTARKFVFENCTLYYNGTAWTTEAPVEYKTFTINGVAQTGAVDGTTFNLYVTDGDALTVSSWDYAFTLESGAGFALNGEAFTPTTLKQPGSDLYIDLGKAFAKGDVLTINGTFVNETAAAKITFVNCTLYFNGTAWSTEAPVEYTTYDLGALEMHANGGTAKAIYLKSPLIATASLPVKTWDHVFTLESGDGLKVNGVQKTLKTFKSTGDGLYFDFDAVNVGDVITISGTFYNEKFATKYTITENQLQWNGTKWVEYVEYKTYTATKVGATKDSTASVLYLYSAEGDLFPKDKASWDYKYTLETGSGNGFMLNDTVLTTGDIKLPGDFYVQLGATAVKGDKLTINGTYYNETTEVKIAFVNCTLYFDGEKWTDTKPVEYTTYNLGEMKVNTPSSNGTGSSRADQLYMKRASGTLPFPDGTWNTIFVLESGDGLKVNGKSVKINQMKSTDAGLWMSFAGVQVGDVVTISGTFVCETEKAKYVIEESAFIWNGTVWANYIDTSAYEAYTVTRIGGYSNDKFTQAFIYPTGPNEALPKELGEWTSIYTFEACSGDGLKINGTALTTTDIKFPGDVYIGLGVTMQAGDILTIDGTYYNTEKGIKIVFVNCAMQWDGSKFVTIDNNYTKITYVTESGSYTKEVLNGTSYQLDGYSTSYKAFIGWVAYGALYQPGDAVDFATTGYTFTALEIDFTMMDGAAIRIASDARTSGLRFTTMLKETDLTTLQSLTGVANVSYGTLILPYDYLGQNQMPNMNDFIVDETILKIDSTKFFVENGYIVYYGAMTNLYTENYDRLFAACGYMEISFANGETMVVYTNFDGDDNVRSIRYVARQYVQDTASDYANLDATRKSVVDAYAATDEIELLDYAAEAIHNMLDITVWEYPALDATNDYNNEANIAITNKMKEAGVKVVVLSGEGQVNMNSADNVEKNRKIIKFFWSQGLKTVAFAEADPIVQDFNANGIPNFSDCEGFIGFIMRDEPVNKDDSGSFAMLASAAIQFNILYAGTGVTYMNNLLPSYWSEITDKNGNVDTAKYKAYLETYCETVLSAVKGEKWLSVDSYPINTDGTLVKNFLFDIAMVKYYSEKYDATSNMIIQASAGWSDGQNRKVSEEEMRMQAYAAMAFGIENISWWTYGNWGDTTTLTSPHSDEATYTAFKNVNNELLAFDEVYKAFAWKGVILGIGKDNDSILKNDNDYQAYALVKGQIGEYELTASDTRLLASVSSSDSDSNYLMGVMQDKNANEAYVLCNYNAVYNSVLSTLYEKNTSQTITITFAKNVTKAIIYRGGVATEVEVNNQTLQVALGRGEGVMVVPSQIG